MGRLDFLSVLNIRQKDVFHHLLCLIIFMCNICNAQSVPHISLPLTQLWDWQTWLEAGVDPLTIWRGCVRPSCTLWIRLWEDYPSLTYICSLCSSCSTSISDSIVVNRMEARIVISIMFSSKQSCKFQSPKRTSTMWRISYMYWYGNGRKLWNLSI